MGVALKFPHTIKYCWKQIFNGLENFLLSIQLLNQSSFVEGAKKSIHSVVPCCHLPSSSLTIASQQRTPSKREEFFLISCLGAVFSFIVASKITVSSRMPISSYATAAMACEGFTCTHPPFSCVLVSWIWNLKES